MTNSDSGNRPRPAAHQPGDRVRVRHNPKHDHSYSVEQNRARQALDGQIGSIRERTVAGAYRVAPPGSTERGAWFEADELEPIVTDADGLPVGGPTSPPVDRPVAELRAGVLAVVDALEAKLGTALQEAQGWHSAALLARGEAEEARQEAQRLAGDLAYIRTERDALRSEADALRGKLGAAEAMLRAEEGSRVAWRNEALREQGERKVAEARLAAVVQAWGKMRALLLGLHRPLGAVWLDALDAVDKALGGAVVKPEREDRWEQTVEQRVSEIEARLARLEGGK